MQHASEGYQFWQAGTILGRALLFKTAYQGKACRPRQVHLSLYCRGGYKCEEKAQEVQNSKLVQEFKHSARLAPGGHLRGDFRHCQPRARLLSSPQVSVQHVFKSIYMPYIYGMKNWEKVWV